MWCQQQTHQDDEDFASKWQLPRPLIRSTRKSKPILSIPQSMIYNFTNLLYKLRRPIMKIIRNGVAETPIGTAGFQIAL